MFGQAHEVQLAAPTAAETVVGEMVSTRPSVSLIPLKETTSAAVILQVTLEYFHIRPAFRVTSHTMKCCCAGCAPSVPDGHQIS